MIWKGLRIAAALLAPALVAPATAAAQCGAGLKVTDADGGGAHYATHELTVTSLPAGNSFMDPRTVTATPGARRLDAADPESRTPPTFVRETAGSLTISAVVVVEDAALNQCTQSVSTVVQLKPAVAPLITVKRPRRTRLGTGKVVYSDPATFKLTLKHRAGSDRRPITLRARAVKRRRLPGRGAKARAFVFGQRPSDAALNPNDDSGLPCLICPKRSSRGFRKSTEVNYRPTESDRLFSRGLRVQLVPPSGYPVGRRFVRTPFGADIELLQGGTRIARLRVAGRCDGSGQSSRCRFRKITTKRN